MRPAYAIMFVFFVSVCRVGGSAEANETWEDHPPWLGTWHANPQVAQILGFSQEGRVPRKKLQIGFFESRDAVIEVAGKELIDRVESKFLEATRAQASDYRCGAMDRRR